jgi:hypothetical protein
MCLSGLPLELVAGAANISLDGGLRVSSMLKCIRLLRLGRLVKILQKFRFANIFGIIRLFMFIFLFAHWAGCMCVPFPWPVHVGLYFRCCVNFFALLEFRYLINMHGSKMCADGT